MRDFVRGVGVICVTAPGLLVVPALFVLAWIRGGSFWLAIATSIVAFIALRILGAIILAITGPRKL